ncbi:MAG: restriction endonuclease subunit S, partial [Pseudomonadota bacterium]
MTTQGWQWAELDEVATVTAGNPAPQGQEFFAGGTHPFVRVQDLGRLGAASHLTATADYVNDKASKALKVFPKGSILFTKSGASLLLNQRAILGRDMHVVSHIGVAVPGQRVVSEWLYYWLRTVDFADIAHGANMPSLPLSRVKKIKIPVPPIEEQKSRVAEIEKQFSRLDEAVAN